MLKRYFALIIVFLQLFFVLPTQEANAAVPPKPATGSSIYVQDYAGILSNKTLNTIHSYGRELDLKTTAQVSVVTVKSLEGQPIEEYALELLRTWGIGQQDKNNGALILVAVNDRKSRIEVGYGLEGALPDGLTGRIQDRYMIPYFHKGNYDTGILQGYLATASVVAKDYNVKLEGMKATTPTKQQQSSPLQQALLAGAILVLLLVDNLFLGGFITRMLLYSIFFRGGGGRGGGGFGGGTFGGGSGGGGGSSRDW